MAFKNFCTVIKLCHSHAQSYSTIPMVFKQGVRPYPQIKIFFRGGKGVFPTGCAEKKMGVLL